MAESLKERFLKITKKKFGNTYDYSLIGEINSIDELLPIICPIHGVFYKSFRRHVYDKRGCPKCKSENKLKMTRFNEETFIEYCKEAFNDKNWSFEKTKYKYNKEKVIITCHEIDIETGEEHGDFEITPGHLRGGQGCPKCRYIKSSASNRRSIEEVIAQANGVHGDKYDYSQITEYKNDRIKYPIVCPEHGTFYMTMNNHIKGKQGCPKCGRKLCDLHRIKTLEHYIKSAREKHENKYEYLSYDPTTSKLTIKCPIHGEFRQSIGNHIYNGEGCPKCGYSTSDGEKELATFISEVSGVTEVLENKRTVLDGKYELDIYLPENNIAFEYDGLYWHCELNHDKNYHLEKTIACEKKGIRLFHIFEDEWINKQEIVKSMIINLLGKTPNKIYARKCNVRLVDSKDSRKFLDNNHLQGYCNSQVRYGLYYKGELVSLMTFGKSRHFVGNGKHEWELLRFCNKLDANIIGGASRLLEHFKKEYSPQEIVSYADRRWSNGNLYDKLGFVKYNESKPSYYYIVGRLNRVYRYNLRKSVLIKKYGCPKDMTEHEFCLKQKWYRIYDCGCLCYRWKK